MASAMIGAALSVVGTALAPFKDSLLEKWAASKQLGSNVKDLELELLSVQAVLEHTAGKEIVDNSALKKLLVQLQDLGYDAEDVLDELDYFRIQDELDGTFEAADEHAKGCVHNLALNAKAVGKQIVCSPSCFFTATTTPSRPQVNGGKAKLITSVGKCFPYCSSLPSVSEDDDDDNRINSTVEQLRLLKQKVSSNITTTLCPNNLSTTDVARSSPITISESIEPKNYVNHFFMDKVMLDITDDGSLSDRVLAVIPIVGPHGVGKTTLVQHVYHSAKVQKRFQVKVWTSVSLNFANANELIEEIQKHIPEVDGESIGTAGELIGQRLKNKRLLLVLDDMWDCISEDQLKQLLAPFKKSHVLGNIILLTTTSILFWPRQIMRKLFPYSLHFGRPISMNNSPQTNQTDDEPPKLVFNRVDASTRMQNIVDRLRSVHRVVSSTIAALGPNWSTVPNIAQSRPTTNSQSIESELYGRDQIMNTIIHDITHDKHHGEVLTVIPIVGPGGIGKTTLAQHIYHSRKVQEHFDVKVWTCVSLNFNASRLIEEIGKCITKVDGGSIGNAGELIEQRLQNKRFLLVLDDIWDCSSEDEWKRLVVPLEKSKVQGNIIIVTTRFPGRAQMVKTIDHPIYLRGLDQKEFKEFFLNFVFGKNQSREDHKFLLQTGDEIIGKLKGSPLAAKTVGRLLKKRLDPNHWNRVLQSKAWEQTDGEDADDILPALKLSYDYLPSQLQRCFSYCALFPQDYKFKREELINFWIGLDVLHPSRDENKSVEDIGLHHLTELVNHGFFEEEGKKDESACYIIHDLLHELARKVTAHECLSIASSQSQVASLQIPPLIRHLSINIEDTSAKDRLTLKTCVEDFNTLDKRLDVKKLRSLMLFGKDHGLFVKAFGGLFREAKALRLIFLSKRSYDVQDLLHNFYNLVHLRYLRIEDYFLPSRFPDKISRFYHMMVLDAKHCTTITHLPSDISNLAKLRHFLVQDEATHSTIVEVRKLKSLQELRRFVIKQGRHGFELRQLGQLVQLKGSLCIDDLENVQAKEEADKAKLMQKRQLHELKLRWNIDRSTSDPALEEHVLERLKPSSNLCKLSIEGNRGATCPSWLDTNLSVNRLESLCLVGVAWKTFPPIGELFLVNVPHEQISCRITERRFENLRRLELADLKSLEKWVVNAPCQLFPFLEELVIKNCFNLVELSLSHSGCCQQEYVNLFPRLSQHEIKSCPQLLSFPPIPWTGAPCSIVIQEIGSSYPLKLNCRQGSNSEYNLAIEGKDTPDSTSWNALAFHNLTRLTELAMNRCQSLPLHHLQMLSSLRKLSLSRVSNAFPFVEGGRHAEC